MTNKTSYVAIGVVAALAFVFVIALYAGVSGRPVQSRAGYALFVALVPGVIAALVVAKAQMSALPAVMIYLLVLGLTIAVQAVGRWL